MKRLKVYMSEAAMLQSEVARLRRDNARLRKLLRLWLVWAKDYLRGDEPPKRRPR